MMNNQELIIRKKKAKYLHDNLFKIELTKEDVNTIGKVLLMIENPRYEIELEVVENINK